MGVFQLGAKSIHSLAHTPHDAIVSAQSRILCNAFYPFCEAESLIMTDFEACRFRYSRPHRSLIIARMTCQKKKDSIILCQTLTHIVYHLFMMKRRLYVRVEDDIDTDN